MAKVSREIKTESIKHALTHIHTHKHARMHVRVYDPIHFSGSIASLQRIYETFRGLPVDFRKGSHVIKFMYYSFMYRSYYS